MIAGALAMRAFGADRSDRATPPANPRAAFIHKAFELRGLAIARGDQPYGAVVVKNNRIIGVGISAVVTNNDPTAHAEMQAIRDAIKKVGEREVRGAELISTSRACSMCESGAFKAGIARMFHGESTLDAGAPRMR